MQTYKIFQSKMFMYIYIYISKILLNTAKCGLKETLSFNSFFFFLWHFTAFEQGPAPTFGHLTYFEDLVRTTSGESVTPVGAHTVALTLLFCVQFTYPRLPIWSFCFSLCLWFLLFLKALGEIIILCCGSLGITRCLSVEPC